MTEVLVDVIASIRSASQLEKELQDPAYRAYVGTALAEGEADIAAGRIFDANQIFERSTARLKRLHG